MKTRIFIFIAMVLFGYHTVSSQELGTAKGNSRRENLKVFTSPDLLPLTTKWVSEYNKINPKAKIELKTTGETDFTGSRQSDEALGFVSDESISMLKNQFNWNMVVARDIIVPVMNETNPCISEIYRNGATAEGFSRLMESPVKSNWGMLCSSTQKMNEQPVHYYFVNDPAIHAAITNFTKNKLGTAAGIRVATEQELILAIQNDPMGLGFCRLTHATDSQNKNLAAHIKLVPIDKNGNGRIDYAEAIYYNLQEFSRGVWIGRYPLPLSGKIYSVSSGKPKSADQLSFLNWVLTDGQRILNTAGYSDLVVNERQSQLDKISEPSVYASTPVATNPFLRLRFLILLAIGVTVVAIEFAFRHVRAKNKAEARFTSTLLEVVDEGQIAIPRGLYFDKTHTWAFMKKDGLVKIGIDDFLLHVTGPLSRIEMKNAGDRIKKGEHLLTVIQKGKQLKIYSPVTGTITAQNQNLITHSGLLNSAPYTDGWIYTIEPTNWLLEIQFMKMAEKYSTWLKDEYLRLRDFFEAAVRVHVPAFIMVLQDGGVLRDGILGELGPEIWDDFQTKFMDVNK